MYLRSYFTLFKKAELHKNNITYIHVHVLPVYVTDLISLLFKYFTFKTLLDLITPPSPPLSGNSATERTLNIWVGGSNGTLYF